ncbi:MAG: succinate--CoA ligase subunit alpha [Candidatus Brocadiia bacterium]|jgi:succinyl-CoA synthetase alpha subunit|nr:succinate--CoA ligase subunit alpha [Candidatus Brocadiia bacterium]
MSILVDSATRLVVQGITGHAGAFHTELMIEYGTQVVAGVTPGKGGTRVVNVPVLDTVAQAVAETGANASVIFVPPPFAADAVMEAADAGVGLIVCITEGIPALQVARARAYVREREARLIGPNCPGVISPGKCKVGIMLGPIHREGRVGVVSRSGTLTYEAIWQLTQLGIGQSTAVGVGGDPVIGSSFSDILELFEHDVETRAVVLIGEIGGRAEEQAAEFVRERMTKPVVAFIAGRGAPRGKRMGHAGAIVGGSSGTAEAKVAALREAGAHVAENPARIGEVTRDILAATP